MAGSVLAGMQLSIEFLGGRGVTRSVLSRPQLKQMSPGMTVEQEQHWELRWRYG